MVESSVPTRDDTPNVLDIEIMSNVAERVAERILPTVGKNAFQESATEIALVAVLEETLAQESRLTVRRRVGPIANWDPQPGGVDVVVEEADGARTYFELKVDNVADSVWDMFKLASLVAQYEDDQAFLLIAARTREWEKEDARVGIFAVGPGCEWETRFLVAEHEPAHRRALSYNPRPLRLPRTILATAFGTWPIPTFPEYELRVVSIVASETDLELVDGWPVANEEWIADSNLKVEDLPSDSASHAELIRFARTSDGYVNYGNFERLSIATSNAYEAWKRSGVVSGSLRELRSFLFFHHRAEHFGTPLDMVYVHALIAKMREALTTRS